VILRTLDDGDDGETQSFEGLNRCDQCADADNRVIDVLWKFIPQFGANFVIGFAFVTIRRSKSYEVGAPFQLSCGMSGAWRLLQHIQLLYVGDTVSLCIFFGHEAT
jgi:hypothetical protein